MEEESSPPNAIYAKIGGILMLFILPLIFGLIPLKAAKLKSALRYTSIANCFGGGVFFGTCFLHLIPEVNHETRSYITKSNSSFLRAVPLAEILECSGFAIMCFVEILMDKIGGGHNEIHVQEETITNPALSLKLEEGQENTKPKRENPTYNAKDKGVSVLLLALAVHSVFEGLAIGVERHPTIFLQLAGAIVVHKCVVAFALGTRIIQADKSLRSMMGLLTVFCICTPIGVALAMVIVDALESADSRTLHITSATIQGLSTGLFLYITFAEMLFEELKNKTDILLKVIAMSVGILLIGVSTVWHNYTEL